MVGIVNETRQAPEPPDVPGIWGVNLPEELCREARVAVTFYLEQEPGVVADGLAAPFPWARVLQGLGQEEAAKTILAQAWPGDNRVRAGIAALLCIDGATWRHARLVEHGVLQLVQGVLGTGQSGWKLTMGLLASQMPELYELAQNRVIRTLRDLLLPLLLDEQFGGNLQISDLRRGAKETAWVDELRRSLEAEAASRPIHVFWSP